MLTRGVQRATTDGPNVRHTSTVEGNERVTDLPCATRKGESVEALVTERADRSIASVADTLDGVALDDLAGAALLDRVDTKFLLPAALVPVLLEEGAAEYRVLTVGGRRISRYRTTYYDTPALDAYRDHLIGRAPRCKVRIREYVESGLAFLEIKWKTSRGRTVKARVPYTGSWNAAVEALCHGPSAALAAPIPWALLQSSIRIDYDRLTLVSLTRAERVTVDLRLAMHSAEESVVYPGVAIVEVKQARAARTGIVMALRRRGIRPAPLSKYCLGVARLYATRVKTHGYRRMLDHLNQIGGGYDVAAADH